MFRHLANVTAAGAAVLGVAIGTALPAGAEPGPQPGSQEMLCHFTLSDPYVVDVSGTPMVSATVTPGQCTGGAQASLSQVCVSSGASAGNCAEIPGYSSVQAYFAPYKPGQSYTARGRGCALALQSRSSVCSSLGPTTVTL